jgi:hypothetical protein
MVFWKLHANIAVGTICLAVGFAVVGKADTMPCLDCASIQSVDD